MRRFAIVAAAIWLCGCNSKEAAQTDRSPSAPAAASGALRTPSQAVSYLDGSARELKTLEPELQDMLRRAELLTREGKVGAAIEILDQVIGKRPQTALAFVLRGQANALVKNDSRALADFGAAIDLEKLNPRHYSARGFFQLSRGNSQTAINDFNKAIELDPNDPVPYNHRGMAQVTRGEIARAIDDFGKAIELDPKFVTAYNNRSFAYQRANRRKDAMADLDKALALDSKAAATYNNRGVMYLDDHEYAKALADFNAAINLDGTNAGYYVNRREAYLKLERYREARADAAKLERFARLEALNEAVLRDRRSPKPYVDRGTFLLDDGSIDLSLANFNRALDFDGKYWPALLQRARAFVRRGDFQKAVADCTAALAISPRDDIYAVRGDAYRKMGDYAKAVADYDASHRIDADVAEAWTLYAKDLRQSGRTKEAALAQRRADEFQAINSPSAN